MHIRTTLAALCLCLGTSAAFAADGASPAPAPAGTGKHWTACQAEITKFCSTIEKGKGKMRACLTEHTADLSDGCKTSMAEHAAKPRRRKRAVSDAALMRSRHGGDPAASRPRLSGAAFSSPRARA